MFDQVKRAIRFIRVLRMGQSCLYYQVNERATLKESLKQQYITQICQVSNKTSNPSPDLKTVFD